MLRLFLILKPNWIFQVMVPYNHTEFIDIMIDLVKKNIISMDRIDDAVRRILRVKFIMGLFENPMADLSYVKHLGSRVSTPLYKNFVGI